jgi:c(7)-type cytochrome triheme protein
MIIRRQLIAVFLVWLLVGIMPAMASPAVDLFLQNFIKNYQAQNFTAQVSLVKESKELVPPAVSKLIDEAMAEERPFGEKMYLLNLASSLAYMQKHWHEDTGPLDLVSPIIKEELAKEKAAAAEIAKWDGEERFLGNFVMKRNGGDMENMGLPPVLYPHWLHRVYFECKVCHNAIFRMQRWSADITRQTLMAGQQCGECHNGTLAFDVNEETCELCHMAGTPESERLSNVNAIDHDKIKKAAEKVGAVWRPENLPDGKLPLDRFKFIDWLEMKRRNVFTPVVSLDKAYKEEVRDNKIRFVSKSDFVDDVIFDHKIHSDWIDCKACHPAIFQDKLGGNEVKMRDMSKGFHCGHCHGKVSFTFADCMRCHKAPKGQEVDGALKRHH